VSPAPAADAKKAALGREAEALLAATDALAATSAAGAACPADLLSAGQSLLVDEQEMEGAFLNAELISELLGTVHLLECHVSLRPMWPNLEDTFLFELYKFADRIVDPSVGQLHSGPTSTASARKAAQHAVSKPKNNDATFTTNYWIDEIDRPTDEASLVWHMVYIASFRVDHLSFSVTLVRHLGILSRFIQSDRRALRVAPDRGEPPLQQAVDDA
jgi:hypothetical protein